MNIFIHLNMNKSTYIIAILMVSLSFMQASAQETNSKEDYSAYLPEVRNFNKVVEKPQPNYPSAAQIAKDRIARGHVGLPTNVNTIVKPTVKVIKGPAGDLSLMVYRPDTVRAVVLAIHGGGWFIGSAADDAKFNDQIARSCKVAVVSVDYRLAPENPFPACIEDCKAAAKWLVSHSKDIFGTDKIFITGSSAGSHLAAVTTLYIRDSLKSIGKVKGVNLFYGIYDLARTPSFRLATDSSVLSKPFMNQMMQLVFGGWSTERLEQPQYSPLFADLHGLPPALFTIGADDPLADDTYFMESRWRAAGNKTYLAVYPESIHGFDLLPTKLGQLSHDKVCLWINNILK